MTNCVAQPQGGELVSKNRAGGRREAGRPGCGGRPRARAAPARRRRRRRPGSPPVPRQAAKGRRRRRPRPGPTRAPRSPASPGRRGLERQAATAAGPAARAEHEAQGAGPRRSGRARLRKGQRAEKRSPVAGPDGTLRSGAAGLAAGADAAGPGEPAAQPRVAGSAAPSAPPPRLRRQAIRAAAARGGAARGGAGPGRLGREKEQSGQRNRAAGAKVRAAPVAARSAAMARYERLRAAGRLHTATVSFSDYPARPPAGWSRTTRTAW